ncbi:hypothetical protein GCM10010104_67200 [Streptomyces indiaensis]|uniref:Uncharacterized protein n=1 Tax=Streptomyces indiaensis TaxID=284033 RepID=A0ABN3EJF8_9ACTN
MVTGRVVPVAAGEVQAGGVEGPEADAAVARAVAFADDLFDMAGEGAGTDGEEGGTP